MIIRKNELSPIDFDGLQIYDYTSSTDTSSSLALIEIPAGSQHATAWSTRSDKYYFIVIGSIDFVLEGEKLALTAGDFCLVRKCQKFSYRNSSSADAKIILVHTPNFVLEAERFDDEV